MLNCLNFLGGGVVLFADFTPAVALMALSELLKERYARNPQIAAIKRQPTAPATLPLNNPLTAEKENSSVKPQKIIFFFIGIYRLSCFEKIIKHCRFKSNKKEGRTWQIRHRT